MIDKIKKPVKISYLSYSIFLIVLLSSVTIFVTIMSDVIDSRLVTTSVMYIFLSMTVLLAFALFAGSDKINFGNKFLFLGLTLIYALSYLWASLSYFTTNQILQEQSLLFLYKIYPKTIVFLSILGVLLVLISLVFILSKKFVFQKPDEKKRKKAKYIAVSSAFLFLLFFFVIPTMFETIDPLVNLHVTGHPVYITPDKIVSEKIIDVETKLEDPNVIVILLESISAESIGPYGKDREVTPNIDALAEESILFENAYTTATHSDYAQPAFLSSRYMLANQYRNFYKDQHEKKMFWEVFSDRDYTSVYFSSQDDLWANMNRYFNYDSLDIYSYSLTDGETDYGGGLEKKDLDHKTMDKVVNWLDSYEENKPFFLHTNLQATHMPLVYPEEFVHYTPDNILAFKFMVFTGLENTLNRYDNALRYVDAQVGRLLDKLEEKGLRENTIIILSADHGHDNYNKHNVAGHGQSLYDEELRIPLIFHVPDIEPRRVSERVSHIDVIPTVVDILGFEIPTELMGKSMEKENRFFFYAQSHRNMVGMIKGDLKIIVDLNKRLVEVYDLDLDPAEENNLYTSNKYDEELLEVLMWHTCQIKYFIKEKKDPAFAEYCENFL